MIQEIKKEEPKQEKKTGNWLTEKDSNYSQFDMSKAAPEKKTDKVESKTEKMKREIAELEAIQKE